MYTSNVQLLLLTTYSFYFHPASLHSVPDSSLHKQKLWFWLNVFSNNHWWLNPNIIYYVLTCQQTILLSWHDISSTCPVSSAVSAGLCVSVSLSLALEQWGHCRCVPHAKASLFLSFHSFFNMLVCVLIKILLSLYWNNASLCQKAGLSPRAISPTKDWFIPSYIINFVPICIISILY